MKTIKIPDETFDFLAWIVRQDITLSNAIADYLKWDRYTREEIKTHLDALNDACIEAAQERLEQVHIGKGLPGGKRGFEEAKAAKVQMHQFDALVPCEPAKQIVGLETSHECLINEPACLVAGMVTSLLWLSQPLLTFPSARVLIYFHEEERRRIAGRTFR